MMMNVLLYREDAQRFLLRLSHRGSYWTEPHDCIQQDYLCLRVLQDSCLDGTGAQRIRDVVIDPAREMVVLPGARATNLNLLREEHRSLVVDALRKGCLVPDRVLDDYPKLRELILRERGGGAAQVLVYGETFTLTPDDVAVVYAFREALERCSALYQGKPDPFPVPELLLQQQWLMSEEGNAWQDLTLFYWQIRSRSGAITPLSQVVTRLVENEISRLARWFQVHGYDDAHIPPPPAIDHDTSCDRPGGWFLKRPAIVFGQVGCCGIEHPEVGGVSVFLDNPGYAMAQWHAAYLWPRSSRWSREKTEAVWAIAREISKMTDWSVVFEQSRKIRRTILTKLRSLVEQHQGQLEDDFAKRFQVD